MDDDDAIPRREAVLGLGLLGALTIALVGAIVFRIVTVAPRKSPYAGAAQIVLAAPAQQLAPGTVDVPAPAAMADAGAEGRENSLPPATPIATSDGDSRSLPAAATSDVVTPPPIILDPPPETSPGAAAPIFVAPASR